LTHSAERRRRVKCRPCSSWTKTARVKARAGC
jgi:hypothetical protein